MTRDLFVLRDVTDFAPGAFENTVVEGGSIRLGRKGAEYLQNGSYTGPPFSAAPFTCLIPSWNADAPPGTTVEVQVRVAAGGVWSRWFSFGKWGPYIDRASPETQQDDIAGVKGELLSVPEGGAPADTAQLRILLATEDPAATPMVRLLALSANSRDPARETLPIADRVLDLPAYSCLVRDPAIAERIPAACSLAMMMNRWGEDALPEEVARLEYDSGLGRFSNLAFVCAAGGMYGYECFAGFAGIDTLRREVWRGHAVAARVHYRAPMLSGEEEEELQTPLEEQLDGLEMQGTQRMAQAKEQAAAAPAAAPGLAQTEKKQPPASDVGTGKTLGAALDNIECMPGDATASQDKNALPLWDSATVNSAGHLVVVCGFTEHNGEKYVVVNDPMAPSDAEVRREMPLACFEQLYMGMCLILHKGPPKAGSAKPVRRLAQLQFSDGELRVKARGGELLPGSFTQDGGASFTVCYTLSDEIAYSSAAQKKFYYPRFGPGGGLKFDIPSSAKRMTVYLIGPKGNFWVAEKKLGDKAEQGS